MLCWRVIDEVEGGIRKYQDLGNNTLIASTAKVSTLGSRIYVQY